MFEGSGPLFYKQNNEEQKIVKVYKNINICKTILGIPSDLLVSGRRNAIPCQIEPAQRRLMRRAPPRSSAQIQTCTHGRLACPAVQSARRNPRPPESSEPKKNGDHIVHIHTRTPTAAVCPAILKFGQTAYLLKNG